MRPEPKTNAPSPKTARPGPRMSDVLLVVVRRLEALKGDAEDLVDVGNVLWVAVDGEVEEGDLQGNDVGNGHLGARLWDGSETRMGATQGREEDVPRAVLRTGETKNPQKGRVSAHLPR